MTFLNIALLAGMAAVAIPVIVHIFNRKKYDVIDWAAMQFLSVSPRTKRKLTIEQLLLMLLRMFLIALVVCAFASPTITSTLFNSLGSTGERDVVIVIDGSASMGYKHNDVTGTDAAKAFAQSFLGRMNQGDRVSIVLAKHQPQAILGTLSDDRERARSALDLIPSPRGTGDIPAAVQAAIAILNNGRAERDVIILTDNQRYGWADESTVGKWDLVGKSKGTARIWVVNIAPDRPADPKNFALDPIIAGRAVAAAGREIRFRSAVRASGNLANATPGKVKLDLDGRPSGEVPLEPGPAGSSLLNFSRKFTPGSHLITLTLDPDDLPADNRQDYAIEVLPAVPVLIVDGDVRGKPDSRGGDLMKSALAPAKDPTPGFLVKVIPLTELTTEIFTKALKDPGSQPRVVILSNVPTLTAGQVADLDKFVSGGGALLVGLGDRADANVWNKLAFRAGQGWLPARLVEQVGAENDLPQAPRPLPASFTHPALELFKEALPGGFQTAIFPKRWKLDSTAGVNGPTGPSGITICSLTNGEPLFIERGVGRGRVILSAIPFDTSWRTNLPTLPDYVRLLHELVYYLAGARAAERNLAPGQPIVFTPRPAEPTAPVTVQPPEAAARVVPVANWPITFADTKEPGAYKVTTNAGQTVWFAVKADPREAVLTPNGEADRKQVADSVPGLQYVESIDEVETKRGSGPQTREIWNALLVLVLLFLAAEVWYTRRLAQAGTEG